jgi:hypothetical protein
MAAKGPCKEHALPQAVMQFVSYTQMHIWMFVFLYVQVEPSAISTAVDVLAPTEAGG